MNTRFETYWKLRLENCLKSLRDNNFGAYLADSCKDAKRIVVEEILPDIDVKSVSWGDSLTLYATQILDAIKQDSDIHILETFAANVAREEIMERRRKALLTDLFFT